MLEECGIKHKRNAPHHPRGNGAVKKVNDVLGSVLTKVGNISRKSQNDRDLRLPKKVFSGRTAEHQSTRMSLAKALINKTLELLGIAMVHVVIPDKEPPIISE